MFERMVGESGTNGFLVSNPAETDFETSAEVKVADSFEKMNLKEDLVRGIYHYGMFCTDFTQFNSLNSHHLHDSGFQTPSAIQQRAIVPICSGRDVIAQAQSGTGKTATFSVGILQSIDTTSNEPQALVLSPTRELAAQIQKVCVPTGSAN